MISIKEDNDANHCILKLFWRNGCGSAIFIKNDYFSTRINHYNAVANNDNLWPFNSIAGRNWHILKYRGHWFCVC